MSTIQQRYGNIQRTVDSIVKTAQVMNAEKGAPPDMTIEELAAQAKGKVVAQFRGSPEPTQVNVSSRACPYPRSVLAPHGLAMCLAYSRFFNGLSALDEEN
ncbi:hypothetical protein TREES_T100003349 [Tupaia chinensis]|uniref:Uncharacterized protein n=1 Tax=Tupaia chinensis TaxID=246437 RepID=L9JB42_TUPCH|nr:hypothetical protein TREES_T100003349 [Tupaia chinensis]